MTERLKRPSPERIPPNRNPAEVLRGLGASTAAPGETDPIARSVGMGYRIVEQYLEQGRSLAAGVAPRGGGAGSGNIVADLTSRMIRTTADLFEVWFQLMDVSGSRAPAPAAAAMDGSASAGAPASNKGDNNATASTGFIVELASSRPAVVAVDLRPRPAGTVMVAHSLRSDDESLPRINAVTIEPSVNGASVIIRIAIPDAQPAGVYNGMIIEESSSLPVGTVSVRLSAGRENA